MYRFLILSALLLPLLGCGGNSSRHSTTPTPSSWTWVSGASSMNQPGIYGTQGSGATANTPGARVSPATWVDLAGSLWMFGGYGVADNASGDMSDLWKWNGSFWTFVGGGQGTEGMGVYGTQGVSAAANIPGARYEAAGWVDASGSFWLYGGLGMDGSGTRGDLADLWRYSSGEWTWIAGSNTASNLGAAVYGSRGIAAANNNPGARVSATTWTDKSGHLWLFGGFGRGADGVAGSMNDLWELKGGAWAWMAGSNLANQYGSYGTQGTGAAANVPGGRSAAVGWTDGNGVMWLFGGDGNDRDGVKCLLDSAPCLLNDLWTWSAGQWTWVGGSNIAQQPGIYGTHGVAATSNWPGGRWFASAAMDKTDTIWLFGGTGYDSTSGASTVYGDLNDLWRYSNGVWTWVSGSNTAGSGGSYGALGVASLSNAPSARNSHVGWIDAGGNPMIFGGMCDSTTGCGKFNDTWRFAQ